MLSLRSDKDLFAVSVIFVRLEMLLVLVLLCSFAIRIVTHVRMRIRVY